MKIHFKYPRCINGKDYSPGIHEVSDSLKEHWYLKALISCRVATLVVEEKKLDEVKLVMMEAPQAAKVEVIEPCDKSHHEHVDRSTLHLENQPERSDIEAMIPKKGKKKPAKGK